jgi:decaprenyl-phosphate phosphoribosyltransferase
MTRWTASALLRLVRPRQWIKNLLVLAAPAAAGVLDEGEYLGRTLLVLVAFCLAASGTYCINDAVDAEADRLHPVKRYRPVAAGEIAASSARAIGVVLVAAGIGVAALTGDWETPALVATYVALTTAYTIWLKHIAVVDIVTVAAGFVIRAVAGAVGTDIPVSDWYLIVASFGSLFLVAGKRSTELRLDDAQDHRRSLADYSPMFLVYLRAVASGVTLLAYCLWAFEKADLADTSFPFFQLSVVPFALIVLRYALLLETEEVRGPEEILLADRQLQVVALMWAVIFGLGVYVGNAPPLTT